MYLIHVFAKKKQFFVYVEKQVYVDTYSARVVDGGNEVVLAMFAVRATREVSVAVDQQRGTLL